MCVSSTRMTASLSRRRLSPLMPWTRIRATTAKRRVPTWRSGNIGRGSSLRARDMMDWSSYGARMTGSCFALFRPTRAKSCRWTYRVTETACVRHLQSEFPAFLPRGYVVVFVPFTSSLRFNAQNDKKSCRRDSVFADEVAGQVGRWVRTYRSFRKKTVLANCRLP